MDETGDDGATSGACTADIGIVAIIAISAPSGDIGAPGVLGAIGWAGTELAYGSSAGASATDQAGSDAPGAADAAPRTPGAETAGNEPDDPDGTGEGEPSKVAGATAGWGALTWLM